MPLAAMGEYMRRLPARMAELRLLMSETAMIPYMTSGDRKSLLEEWRRTSGHEVKAKPPSLARLKLMGIGVRHVAPPPRTP